MLIKEVEKKKEKEHQTTWDSKLDWVYLITITKSCSWIPWRGKKISAWSPASMCCFISVCIQYPNKRQSPDEEREKRRSINKSLFPKSQTVLGEKIITWSWVHLYWFFAIVLSSFKLLAILHNISSVLILSYQCNQSFRQIVSTICLLRTELIYLFLGEYIQLD